jgi:three-Cys-motif partner protein
MFLDPFGMQVEWKTIELIAATKAIDLWSLFPIGAVNRLLGRAGCDQPGFAARLDAVLGASDWRERFYKRSVRTSLFGDEEQVSKDSDFGKFGEYVNERLGTVFAGVAKKRYILRNSKNSPIFMLCFAVGNPKAVVPAIRIAEYLLKE